MSKEFVKRVLTSFFLIILLVLMYFYNYILILSVIIISINPWIEFYSLVSKIFSKEDIRNKILRFIYKSFSLLYLFLFVAFFLIILTSRPDLKIFLIFPLFISIASDIGGFVVGKIVKGKKLTKLSPNKTISGSIGSFVFSFLLVFFFKEFFEYKNLVLLIFITLGISLISQLGDLFFSYIKRKAKVKHTSNILPGHGGFLDRIDGILFSVPLGFLLLVTL